MTTSQPAPGVELPPLPEPVARRFRYRSAPGMIGHYPWSYTDQRRRRDRIKNCEIEDLFTSAQVAEAIRAALAARDAAAPAQWQLMTSPFTVQTGDEFLQEDCKTWKPVVDWCMGMQVNPPVFLPIRRPAPLPMAAGSAQAGARCMSTYSGGYGPEEEDGAGWGGLVASKAEQRAEGKQAALERDARRFRWLQEHTVATGLSRWMGSVQTLDVAVDAAMRRPSVLASPAPRQEPAALTTQFDHLAGRGLHELRTDEMVPYLRMVTESYGAASPEFDAAAGWIVSELERKTNDERVIAVKLAALRAAPQDDSKAPAAAPQKPNCGLLFTVEEYANINQGRRGPPHPKLCEWPHCACAVTVAAQVAAAPTPAHEAASQGQQARPLAEWHEDVGDVLWWSFPIDEAPYCGHPNCDDWPGYHTHWTPLVVPTAPVQQAGEGAQP